MTVSINKQDNIVIGPFFISAGVLSAEILKSWPCILNVDNIAQLLETKQISDVVFKMFSNGLFNIVEFDWRNYLSLARELFSDEIQIDCRIYAFRVTKEQLMQFMNTIPCERNPFVELPDRDLAVLFDYDVFLIPPSFSQMRIRMYNCFFGDCFWISNGEKNLIVDCGIHKNVGSRAMRNRVFDYIYSDFKRNDIDFLLSHYHEDHCNGAIHIMEKGISFKDVYIPDIWSSKKDEYAIADILLEGIIRNCFLPDSGNKVPLIDFLRALCGKKVHLICRGKPIQKDYVALWPTKDYVYKRANKVFKDAITAGLKETNANELLLIAKGTRRAWRKIASGDENHEAPAMLDRVEEQIVRLKDNLVLEDKGITILLKLNSFANDISIVFQNKKYAKNENILFLGDFGDDPKLWDKIVNPDDGKYLWHSNYHAIKVAHHGTEPHYYSFEKYMDSGSVLMIPNGMVKNLKIYKKYSSDANKKGAKVVCSSCDSCQAVDRKKAKCKCQYNEIIVPRPYVDIL